MEWWQAYEKIRAQEKVPRKLKKAVLGLKLSKAKLRRKLRQVQIIENKYPEAATILPEPFCPRCGCSETDYTDNMAFSDDYRDEWRRGYCLRCGFLVWEVDNSPMMHCLEYPEFDYNMDK
jgi:hypothetical protein